MSWDRLLGQEAAKRVLQNQLRLGQLGHAYLFMGPPETGKGLAALILAQAVNCTADDKPCGECTSCRQTELGVHADLSWVVPDGASIKLQQVKDLLAEAVLTPNVGPYRVFVLEDAHRLTPEAANALLLVLEDPPSFDLFILTATAPLMPTIESRCQVVRFPQSAARAASFAQNGQPASSLPDDAAEPSARQRARDLVLALQQTSLGQRAKLVDELVKKDDGLAATLVALLALYRDFTIWQTTKEWQLVKDKESVELLYADLAAGPGDLLAASQAILDVQRRLANNVNKRLALEYLLYKL